MSDWNWLPSSRYTYQPQKLTTITNCNNTRVTSHHRSATSLHSRLQEFKAPFGRWPTVTFLPLLRVTIGTKLLIVIHVYLERCLSRLHICSATAKKNSENHSAKKNPEYSALIVLWFDTTRLRRLLLLLQQFSCFGSYGLSALPGLWQYYDLIRSIENN